MFWAPYVTPWTTVSIKMRRPRKKSRLYNGPRDGTTLVWWVWRDPDIPKVPLETVTLGCGWTGGPGTGVVYGHRDRRVVPETLLHHVLSKSRMEQWHTETLRRSPGPSVSGRRNDRDWAQPPSTVSMPTPPRPLLYRPLPPTVKRPVSHGPNQDRVLLDSGETWEVILTSWILSTGD